MPEGYVLQWGLMLSWSQWLYSGFASLGTIAGQVHQPGQAYTTLLYVLFPLTIAVNFLPIAAALSVNGDWSSYIDGQFAGIAGTLGGAWLQNAYSVAGIFSFFGLFTSQSLTAQTLLVYLLQCMDPHRRCNDSEKHGRERSATLFNAIISSGIVLFVSYGDLLQAEMLLGTLTTFFLAMSFVVLRVTQPNTPRPFVAGSNSIVMAVCLMTPVVIMTSLNAIGVVWSGIQIIDGENSEKTNSIDGLGFGFGSRRLGVSSSISVPVFMVAIGFLAEAVTHGPSKVRLVE